MEENIRIKDIAEKAGVSVGTVDRVLHKRPNVSEESRKKVEKVLNEINYRPNMYASALARGKKYVFHCIIPRHDSEAYWEEIEEGVNKACEMRRDFNISTHIVYYERFNNDSFRSTCHKCIEEGTMGVIIVASELKITKEYTDELHDKNIPFVLLDSFIPDLNPLSFYGQDSFRSGSFAARMMMLLASSDKEIMMMKQTKDGKVASRQQNNRQVGFRHYMRNHFPEIIITELDLPLGSDVKHYDEILHTFFAEHPNVHHCITFNSKAYIIGEYLLKNNLRNVQIMGYDVVERNAECLKQGAISFLIAQHAYMQGFYCVDSLFKAIVLKEKVDPINYMPIELLTRENIDFYRREQL